MYHLRNAVFEVRSIREGNLEVTLFGDNEFFGNTLRTGLAAGNYTITLLPGWFIESEGNTGGVASQTPTVAPPFPTIFAPIVDAGPPVAATSPVMFPPDAGPPPVTAPTLVPPPMAFCGDGIVESSEECDDGNPFDGDGCSSKCTLEANGGGGRIRANLLSDAVQFVTVFSQEESFVSYFFEVGDNIIPFGPGALNVDFQVIENGVEEPGDPVCNDGNLGRRPSVIETDIAALANITLRDALTAISSNGGFSNDGLELYQHVIDSYATVDQGRLPEAVHCGDETTNGQPTLNGYPIRCNRAEKDQFDNLDAWFPTAFVNRIDLAPLNGAHCGQQRVAFGNDIGGRMLMILEAQIPNPNPQLGILGCAPLAQFWADLTQEPDAAERGRLLAEAFLTGSPKLQADGFGPFYTATNLTIGSGQIRTNNFNTGIWTLREFKLIDAQGSLKPIPFPVAEAPNGELWNDTSNLPAGPACRDAFIQAMDQVINTDNPSQMSFVIPQECKDAESENLGTQAYAQRMNEGSGNFTALLEAAVASSGLTSDEAANRAQFAGSCIGCHIEANGIDLGRGVVAPFSAGFVHVEEEFQQTCESGVGLCFPISQGLQEVFLPHRISVMQNLVSVELPPQCGVITPPPPDVDAGPPPMATGAVTVGVPVPGDAGVPQGDAALPPAPIFTPVLPTVETPTEELVQLDYEVREVFGDTTLGGQSARTTH